jgi:hypothetical protein
VPPGSPAVAATRRTPTSTTFMARHAASTGMSQPPSAMKASIAGGFAEPGEMGGCGDGQPVGESVGEQGATAGGRGACRRRAGRRCVPSSAVSCLGWCRGGGGHQGGLGGATGRRRRW